MLTLGLMEGVLSATVGLLVLVGAANENAPLHKLFGPLVTLVVGIAAYGIHASGAVKSVTDVVGLAFFAVVAFFAPLGIMRAAWKMGRAAEPASKKDAVGSPVAESGTIPRDTRNETARKVA